VSYPPHYDSLEGSNVLQKIHLKRAKLCLSLIVVLILNSAYLFVADRMPGPPRVEFAAFFYIVNVILHLLLGVLLIVPFALLMRALRRSLPGSGAAAMATGWLLHAALVACVLSGLYLLAVGNLRPQRPVWVTHSVAAIVALLSGSVYLALRARAQNAPEIDRWLWRKGRLAPIGVILGVGVILATAAALPVPGKSIENPRWAPDAPTGEGDGPGGKFFPSSAQSVGGKFFPSEYFMDSESCGEAGCHPDIVKQWKESAHHMASFNNQWYRKAIEYMQEVVGTQPSKWCGGCHDMAVLLTEKPGTGKSRMDFPIKDQNWPPEKFPEAHSGIGCAVCHSIVHVKSTMGQADYLADYPPMHKYASIDNPAFKTIFNFVTRRAPEPHKKTFLKPFHRDDTADFCSSCHKVHLDKPVNHYRWLRGFNDYDAWQQSGVSGFGARSFYYPMKPDGTPNFQKCGNCHMPLVASNDAGNINGKVHSHRFPAANTALPTAHKLPEQFETVKKFLQDGILTVDVFGLRRQKGGVRTTNDQRPTTNDQRPKRREETPVAASLMGDDTEGGGPSAQHPAPSAQLEELHAPLDHGGVTLKRGETVVMDVVVRTRKIGHAFPGGTFDAFDVWTELQGVDDRGKVIYHSGNLEWPDGPVERSAHFYRARLLDAKGNVINKRNAWAARSRLYARAIPPGAADVVHYRVTIPKDCGDRVTFTAKLNYRKFDWWNTQFAFAGRPEMKGNPAYGADGKLDEVGLGHSGKHPDVTPDFDNRPMRFDAATTQVSAVDKQVPILPIVVVAEGSVTLPVVGSRLPAPGSQPEPSQPGARSQEPGADDPKKLRERWNDYGIGLLLQRDFLRANAAFKRVTEIAPAWPEGWVNIGRTQLQEGNLAEAQAAFKKALALYDKAPTPMTPYYRARTQFFYAQVLKNYGRYAEAEAMLKDVLRVFPRDRNVRNQIGRIYFLQARFDQAIPEFEQALAVDPEDLTAHYNLMLCYKGKGDLGTAKRHEKLYFRFKADESSTQITGPYMRKHPWDNNEAQTIHEHEDGRRYIRPAPQPAPRPGLQAQGANPRS
jgi:Flp pilus assembly protein TadD